MKPSRSAWQVARIVGFVAVGLLVPTGLFALATGVAAGALLLLGAVALALTLLPNLVTPQGRMALAGAALIFIVATVVASPVRQPAAVETTPTATQPTATDTRVPDPDVTPTSPSPVPVPTPAPPIAPPTALR